ncbi:exopolysaccharide biosynthesis polyprenyl glycosylphosphotransferase [Bosea thiooxidans]
MNFIDRNVGIPLSGGPFPHKARPAPERPWPVRYQAIEPLAVTVDSLVILLTGLGVAVLYHMGGYPLDVRKTGGVLLVAALFVGLLKARGFYRPTELMVLRNQLRAVATSWALVFVLLAGVVGLLDIRNEVPVGVGPFALFGLVALAAHRVAIKAVLSKGLNAGSFRRRNVVLITQQANPIETGFEDTLRILGFAVKETFLLAPSRTRPAGIKQLSARVIRYLRNSDVEEIVIEADPNSWPELRCLVHDLRVTPLPVVFFPMGGAAEIFRRPPRDLGATVCFELQRAPLGLAERAIKRALDVAVAGFLLLLLAPLLVAVAIAVRLDSPGPVLFRQHRCGFSGRGFVIWKFRTMSVLEDGSSLAQAQRSDRRTTRIGRWLRRTSIDELPQLLNVLDGSMSLVGPRPHALAHENQFEKVVRNYAYRRRVKPGLTGWAQVHGCRGPTPTTALIERRVEYDLWYIDNWSLGLDFSILLRTPIEVLRARNAF